ncbi:peptide/nickel transport system substrate-binding protein [Parafrankia irregularis]|uniref:Peptide/nickel transport system substrate-binding protein n=2 Tax=Frankiaceae TaxID=74712 RepID=A0A0S4QJV6_9ACTN|nr:ABC transporter substrate-binding protein [Parafrankia sp. CH37]CUU55847.1 peptide/nickel transport system substrate-binding protein [Parafrankia irregularis]
MSSRSRWSGTLRALVALLAAAMFAAAGCSGEPDPAPGPMAASPSSAPTTSAPVDKPGGTLRLLTGQMPSGDPGWADEPGERAFARLVTRQLYSYPSDTDVTGSTIPRPDLAVGAPVVSEDRLAYTVRLRSAARWNTPSQRRITATDVARGFKRLCSPPTPSPMRGYYAATIRGFAEFCTQLASAPVADAPALIESGSIPGVEVVGDDTIVFHLLKASNDFVDLLALPASSPVPLEALAYPADSPEYLDNLISAGPYRFVPAPDGSYLLSRNPSWSGSSDGIRRALPDHITVTDGLTPETIAARIQAGEGDMALDGEVPAGVLSDLAGDGDDRLAVSSTGPVTALVVGLNGPSAAALREQQVRAALAYCVDRAAVVDALGGPTLAGETSQLLQPPMTGYEEYDPYAAGEGTGDPERCGEGLANNPGGKVTALSLLTTDSATDAAVAQALRTAFARAGIRLDVRIRNAEQYQQAVSNPQAQFWDLALTTIDPDWFGDAGRTVYQPLLDETWVGTRPADGGYRLEDLQTRLEGALTTLGKVEAAADWSALEHTVVSDAAVVPLAVRYSARLHSATVVTFTIVPSLGTADPTAVALAP